MGGRRHWASGGVGETLVGGWMGGGATAWLCLGRQEVGLAAAQCGRVGGWMGGWFRRPWHGEGGRLRKKKGGFLVSPPFVVASLARGGWRRRRMRDGALVRAMHPCSSRARECIDALLDSMHKAGCMQPMRPSTHTTSSSTISRAPVLSSTPQQAASPPLTTHTPPDLPAAQRLHHGTSTHPPTHPPTHPTPPHHPRGLLLPCSTNS